jgi:hypothetical protein
VVAEARDPVQAGIWIDALERAGIPATSFERGVGAALGGASTPGSAVYPVVVGRDDVIAARNVIADLGGAAFLAPLSDIADIAEGQRWVALVVALLAVGVMVLAVVVALVSG